MEGYFGSQDSENTAPWGWTTLSDPTLPDIDITAVVIESGVTRIGTYAFAYCTSLTTILMRFCEKLGV